MIRDGFMKVISYIQWERLRRAITGKSFNLDIADWYQIKGILEGGYYIILTYKKAHLSTYACRIAHFFLTGRWGPYAHALVNVEGERGSYGFPDFKFVEATSPGVHVSKWLSVFACDGVCILKPRYYTTEDLNLTVGVPLSNIGKGYDRRLNVLDETEMSCVEVARHRMLTLPEYSTRMRVFEYMIQNEKNLTPQMFRDCPDFEVLLEIRR